MSVLSAHHSIVAVAALSTFPYGVQGRGGGAGNGGGDGDGDGGDGGGSGGGGGRRGGGRVARRAAGRGGNRNVRRYRHRIYRNRIDFFGMSAEQVLRAYRFDKATILELTRMVQDDLEPKINIYTSTPPLIKVISVLHFCASGSFQNTVGLATGMSQPCFSGILRQVLPAFLRHVKNHISFPVANAEVAAVKGGFYRVARIPHVVGAIDGSHIPLTPPAQRAHVYINRKKFHSINVQAVCSSDMVFTHCCARFPGSAHDATVMQNSSIPRLMAGLQQQTAWLLGDAGYPCEQWLLTPLRNPRTPAEVAFNRAHVKTRNVIERSFGLLKSRFRCLHRTGGALLYAPEKVCHIVLLCFMLHNIAIQRRVPLPPDNEPNSDESDADSSGSEQDQQACPPINPRIPLAQQARARVIQDYFT